MWNKLGIFVICALLPVKYSVTENPDDAKSLVSLIDDVFKPAKVDFESEMYFSTGRYYTTLAPVKPPSFHCPNGKCVAQYLCNNSQINTDGWGSLDLKFTEQIGPQEGEQDCYDYWETCCEFEHITTNPVVKTSPTPLGCGYRNRNGVSYHTTNSHNQSEYGEFPWMVAILRDDPFVRSPVYWAGGSIIHPSVILTAAHYVQIWVGKESRLVVRAGEWDTQTPNELVPHQEHQVSRIIVHERFNDKNLHNDIALLILATSIVLNDVIQPICLPSQNQISDFSQCISTGWGKTEFGRKGKYSVILKKIDLAVIPNKSCQDAMRTTQLGSDFILDESFICADAISQADGGSPLACSIQGGDPNRYYQGGVVSWAIGYGDAGIPGAYTNVALFRSWINQQLEQLEIETSYYEMD